MNRVAKLSEEDRLELAEDYKTLISCYDFDKYVLSNEISNYFKISPREWRKYVEDIMHLFMYGYLDKMFIGTKKGYLLTNDKDLINKFLIAKEHQFKALAYNCYNLKKAILQKDNYTIDDFLIDTLCE